ncbi:MAG: hypothetical protein AB2807_01825 [Candidatus Sedimenticola endophacoides]
MSDEIKRILVVDDEEEIRDAFLLALADLRDLVVTAFDNGGTAVEWAREPPPTWCSWI